MRVSGASPGAAVHGCNGRTQAIHGLLAPDTRTAASSGALGWWLRSLCCEGRCLPSCGASMRRSLQRWSRRGLPGNRPDNDRMVLLSPARSCRCCRSPSSWATPRLRTPPATLFRRREQRARARSTRACAPTGLGGSKPCPASARGRRALVGWRKQAMDGLRSPVEAMDGGARRCASPPGHGGPPPEPVPLRLAVGSGKRAPKKKNATVCTVAFAVTRGGKRFVRT